MGLEVRENRHGKLHLQIKLPQGQQASGLLDGKKGSIEMVIVRENDRRRGTGSRLYSGLVAEMHRRGATSVRGTLISIDMLRLTEAFFHGYCEFFRTEGNSHLRYTFQEANAFMTTHKRDYINFSASLDRLDTSTWELPVLTN